MCGLAADARQLVNKARQESTDYQMFYSTPITAKVLSDRLGGHIHTHTLYWYLRPFGCALLLGMYDEASLGGPSLYSLEPSGQVSKFFACALGRQKQGATNELEKLDFTTITVKQAVNDIARIVYKLHDTLKEKELELELSWICDESDRKVAEVPAQLRATAIEQAKALKQKEDMEESDDEEEEKAAPTTATSTTTVTTAADDATSPQPMT